MIFITENNVIGKGKAVYPIGRCFLETGKVFFDDSHIIYVNGSYRGDLPVGKLMEDLVKDRIDETKKETAQKMLQDVKLSFETIAEYSGLTVEEITELAKLLI